jgi:hypothetical protein
MKTKQWLQENVKSIFTTSGSENTSEKYTHIPTYKVVEDMELLGWEVEEAKEVKARKNVGFQKHLLIFRNPNVVINGKDGDTIQPQIILTNSSDGKNAFSFRAGMYRFICENGLIIGENIVEPIKIRHMGYSFEDLRISINSIIEKLPLTVESMNKMKEIELNETQLVEFANKALTVRFTEEELKTYKVDIFNLLQPTRDADSGNGLWEIFNVFQEKIIKGNFQYFNGKKYRKARPIKNFNQDLEVNSKLFDLALEYVS